MKKYNTILFVVSLILLLSGLFLNINKPKKANSDIKNNSVMIDAMYQCLVPDTCTNPNLNYKIETYYHFYVTNSIVANGNLEKKYIFNDNNSFNEFQYNPSSMSIKSYNNVSNEKELTKSYYYYLLINGTITDVTTYLNELKEKEFICERIS